MVERSAVNRNVAGSSPARGANFQLRAGQPHRGKQKGRGGVPLKRGGGACYPSPPASFSFSGCTYSSLGSGCAPPHTPAVSPLFCIRNELAQPCVVLFFSSVPRVQEGGSLAGNDSREASSTTSRIRSTGGGLDSCFSGLSGFISACTPDWLDASRRGRAPGSSGIH